MHHIRTLATMLALAFSASLAIAQPVVMRVSHQVPPAHHLSRLLEAFAADVKARTNGQVEVQLFGSEQLEKAGENFPAVAKGSIEAAMSVNFQWGKTIPEMSALTIPYFFTDLERIKRFPQSEARKFLDAKLDARGVKSVMWLYITRQSIFTSSKAPLVKLEDFKGVKIRGLNQMTDVALTAVGAAPSAMPGSEVYQALQSGVLDAGLTDLSAAYSRKFFEVRKVRNGVAVLYGLFPHVRQSQVVEWPQARAPRGDRSGGGEIGKGCDRRDREDGRGRDQPAQGQGHGIAPADAAGSGGVARENGTAGDRCVPENRARELSNCQRPSTCTIGIGSGQSSCPTSSSTCAGPCGTSWCFSSYAATKRLSWAASA